MKKKGKPRIVVIVGPTASGKSALAVELARAHNGEVISADSRQVYKGLDIGSGKITRKEMKGVPHHLLDVADPKRSFTVVMYKALAEKAIQDILSRGKVPIMCGGTGFYIEAVVDNVIFPDVPPNKKLRAKLQKVATDALLERLQKLDPKRAKAIDPYNRVRLIRSIEIATALGTVPPAKKQKRFNSLWIGIQPDALTLRAKIAKRLNARMKQGMLQEVQTLHKRGLSWKRMEALGLEYRFLSLYFQGKLTKQEMLEQLETEIWHYARRQMTWFRRNKNIHWLPLDNRKETSRVLLSHLS